MAEAQKIAIHILPIISRRKGNQTTKFSELIENNMRNHTQIQIHDKYNFPIQERRLIHQQLS